MNVSLRTTAVAVFATTLVLAGCKPLDKESGQPVDGEAKPAATAAMGGLKTEKEQVSYVLGTGMGTQLEPIKDEINVDALVRAMKDAMAGKESKLSEAEAMQVMQAFGERMQAKQLADMEAQKSKNAAEGDAFFAENGKKPGVVTTASGLQYQVLTEGTGPKPKLTDTIRVHYKGTLLDGETFDSSIDRGEPVQFGLAQVVPGWQEGLQLMPVGSKYKLWIPGKLGYGEQGTPGGPIGPNATLVFEVELLEIVGSAE